jgi:deazaflavin-dependent oxidoreductase (nitroreductase family)
MTEGTNVDHPFRSERGRRAACRSLVAATAEKLTSPMHATIFGAGLSPRRWVVLEVAGRRSGQTRRFPIAMADYHGELYVVSRLGERCHWVRNVRAAAGIVTIRHGRRRRCRLVEIPVQDWAPIIKAYLTQVPFGRLHVPVDHTAAVSAFEAIADRYPVFRVEPYDGGPYAIGDRAMASAGAEELPASHNDPT